MTLDDLDIILKRSLNMRLAAGEEIYLKVLVEDEYIRKDAIVRLVGFYFDDYPGADKISRANVVKAGSEFYFTTPGRSLALAPHETKCWTPKRPKPVKPALSKIRLKDGLGREIKIGDFLVLVDNERLKHVVFDSHRADTIVVFRDIKDKSKFNRVPVIKTNNEGERWATFRESLKIDKDTN